MAVRQLVVDVVAAALWWSGVSRPARRGRDRLTIVTFHRVLPPAELRQYPYPGIAVTPEELRWAVDRLRDHFTIEPVSASWDGLLEGRPSERPRLSVTFDDGQWDNLVHAAPVLAASGVTATFYVPVEPIADRALIWHDDLGYAITFLTQRDASPLVLDLAREHALPVTAGEDLAGRVVEAAKRLDPLRRTTFVQAVAAAARRQGHEAPDWGRLMTWDEVRSLHRQGHEIGSHSLSHSLLPQLDPAAIEREIAGSKRAIEEALDATVTSFCYPNGDNDPRCREVAATSGYRNAVSTSWGRNASDADAFALARCDLDLRRSRDRRGRPSEARLAMRLGGLQPGLG